MSPRFFGEQWKTDPALAIAREILIEDNGKPRFLVRAWEPVDEPHFWRLDSGRAGSVEFAVWEIDGIETATGRFLYTPKGEGCSVSSVDDATRTAYGTVKWDGCVNFEIQGSEDRGCMLHACGFDGLRLLCEAVQTGYRMAAEILGIADPQIASR